jgi:RimJ/RimL family protein N-acetyltransferase
LRRFELSDARAIQGILGEREVAANLLDIPHPYPDGDAENWINQTNELIRRGEGFTFAAVRKADEALMGAVGIGVELKHLRGEIGYWLGIPFWGQGYATEAAARVVRYGFDDLGLNRIMAYCFSRNLASARVMQKIGMKYEGTFKKDTFKWGEFLDVDFYALLRHDWKG